MKKCVAELMGTFALVFAGTGAVIINEASGGAITQVGIALTFGLIVLAMIYTVGDISGAHLNPAVSLGFFAARRFPLRDVIPYILSQCAGAFAASGILRFLFPKNATLGATLPAGSVMQSFVLELILTAILMFVILNVLFYFLPPRPFMTEGMSISYADLLGLAWIATNLSLYLMVMITELKRLAREEPVRRSAPTSTRDDQGR